MNDPATQELAHAAPAGPVRLHLPARLDRARLDRLTARLAGVDPARPMVIAGAAGSFAAEGDGRPDTTEAARRLVRAIRARSGTSVAALSGAARGEGLEIALAADWRIARADCRLAFDQVARGHAPGAGATQLLPALVGAGPALGMILGGGEITADAAPDGLIDLIDPAPEDAAIAVSRAEPARLPPAGMSDPFAYLAATAEARRHAPSDPVREAVIASVEAVLLLPGGGWDREEAAWRDTLDSAPARRAAFVSALRNRAAAAADAAPARLGLIGQGQAAADLARDAVLAGLRVDLTALDPSGLGEVAERAVADIEAWRAAGRISNGAARDALARLSLSEAPEVLSDATMVLAAGFDNARLIDELGPALDAIAAPGVAVAVIDPVDDVREWQASDRHAVLVRPDSAPGMLEIAVPAGMPDAARSVLSGYAAAVGRLPLLAEGGPLLSRLRRAGLAAADALVLLGAAPEDVDAALRRDPGLSAGPFAARGAETPEGGVLAALAARGADLSEAVRLAAALRRERGIAARSMTRSGLSRTWQALMVAVAARLGDEGVDPATLDLAALAAFGLPDTSGGMSAWASEQGEAQVRDRLSRLAADGLGPPVV